MNQFQYAPNNQLSRDVWAEITSQPSFDDLLQARMAAQSQSLSSQVNLPVEQGQAYGPRTRFDQYKNNFNDWSRNQYAEKRGYYNIADDLDAASFNAGNSLKTGRQALSQSLDPRTAAGKYGYGAGALAGGFTTISNLAAGEDIGDSLARGGGSALGTVGGTAIGRGIGMGLAPLAAAIPIPGVNVAAAAALPLIGGAIGGLIGSNTGSSVGGNLWDRMEGDRKDKEEARSIEGLGSYAQFLSPDEQQALGSYLAFSKAQQDLTRDDAMFADAMAREQFREAAKIDFDNNASLETLRSRAAMEQDRQRSNYELAMNNSNNLWSGINNNVNAMASLYR